MIYLGKKIHTLMIKLRTVLHMIVSKSSQSLQKTFTVKNVEKPEDVVDQNHSPKKQPQFDHQCLKILLNTHRVYYV